MNVADISLASRYGLRNPIRKIIAKQLIYFKNSKKLSKKTFYLMFFVITLLSLLK